MHVRVGIGVGGERKTTRLLKERLHTHVNLINPYSVLVTSFDNLTKSFHNKTHEEYAICIHHP